MRRAIFISYRRDDQPAWARLLHLRLCGEFGAAQVYIDVDGIEYGRDFVAALDEQLQHCEVMLVVIGPGWAGPPGAAGLPRLHEPGDFVRTEVRTALQRGIAVVPVLVAGARMPAAAALPDDLQPLVRRQALELDVARFESDVARLAVTLRKVIEPPPPDAAAGEPVPVPPPDAQARRPAAIVAARRPGWPWIMAGAAGLAVVAWLGYRPAAEPQARVSAASAPGRQAPAAEAAPQAAAAPVPRGQVLKDCAACPDMVVVPAGSFLMGSPAGEPERQADEGPQRRIAIERYAIGRTEVTQGQWRALMGANPSHHKPCGDDCPVERVSWDDAQAYVRRLSEKTGQSYALPTEAQWEYAARAGTGTPFHTGRGITTAQANFDGNYPYDGQARGEYRQAPVAVARFPPNAYGLHDMHGNVAEWTQDCYAEDAYAAGKTPADGRAYDRPGCIARVVRGGSWDSIARYLRSADRGYYAPDFRDDFVGLRVARVVEPR